MYRVLRAIERLRDAFQEVQVVLDQLMEQELQDVELRQVIPRIRQVHPQPIALNTNEWSDTEFKSLTRFTKEDFQKIHDAFKFNPKLLVTRYMKVSTQVGLFLTLRRMAYPERLFTLGKPFGIDDTVTSRVINSVLKEIRQKTEEVLRLDKRLLTPELLKSYAQAYVDGGALLDNVIGFIDGTHFDICFPSVLQELFYSGHSSTHCLKLHVVVLPNGLTVSISQVFEGTAHDKRMLEESLLEECIRPYLVDQQAIPLSGYKIYGDMGYTEEGLVVAPRRQDRYLPDGHIRKATYNSMSSLRVQVEHEMKLIKSLSKLVTFKGNLKLFLQDVPTMLVVSVLIANMHAVCYSNQTASTNDIHPPFADVADYLSFILEDE